MYILEIIINNNIKDIYDIYLLTYTKKSLILFSYYNYKTLSLNLNIKNNIKLDII